MKILMIVCYLIFTVSGLILMKKGGNAGTITNSNGEFGFNISWISALGFVEPSGNIRIPNGVVFDIDN